GHAHGLGKYTQEEVAALAKQGKALPKGDGHAWPLSPLANMTIMTDESWSLDATVPGLPHTVDTILTHTFASTGTVTMSCASGGNKWVLLGKSAELGNTRIVAIRVNAEHKSALVEAT